VCDTKFVLVHLVKECDYPLCARCSMAGYDTIVLGRGPGWFLRTTWQSII
jgi:hypothetical protein